MAETGLTDTIWAGNKRTMAFTVTDEDAGDGSPKDLTALTIKFALSSISPSGQYSTEYLVQKTSGGGGITVTDATAGELEVDLDPADTASLGGRDVHFELEVFDGSGEGVVVAEGTLTVKRNVVNT